MVRNVTGQDQTYFIPWVIEGDDVKLYLTELLREHAKRVELISAALRKIEDEERSA